MSITSLTEEFNASNVLINEQPELDQGNSLDIADNAYIVDVPEDVPLSSDIVKTLEEDLRAKAGVKDGGANELGLMATNSQTTAVDLQKRKDNEKKKQEAALRLIDLIKRLDDARNQLNEDEFRIDVIIAGLLEEQNLIQDMLDDVKAIKAGIAKILIGEELELDEDGSLSNKRLENAIQGYERDHGCVIDREDNAMLLAVLEVIQPTYPSETLLTEQSEEVSDDLDKAYEIKGGINDLQEEGEHVDENSPEEVEAYTEKVGETAKDGETGYLEEKSAEREHSRIAVKDTQTEAEPSTTATAQIITMDFN